MGRNNNETVQTGVVLKSGIWYTISNFAFRAIAFITTPVFSRVLSQAEYGEYNNINSWVAILVVLAACDLHSSIIRAKLDFEEDLESYSFSVLTLSSIITIAFYLFIVYFKWRDFRTLVGNRKEIFSYYILIYLVQ